MKHVGLVVLGSLTLALAGCGGVNFAPTTPISLNKDLSQPGSVTKGPFATVTETYQVPGAQMKADVLFVIDSTPTMFSTITSLQSRLGSLSTEFANVDWQAGIVNSSLDDYDTSFRFHAGELLPLNSFPEDLSSSLYILKPDDASSDWILGRNLSFNGQDWSSGSDDFCSQQPYCAVGASQPLKAIETFIANQSHAANSGFLRADSTFVPVIISAQDENGDGTNATSSPEVINAFNQSLGATMQGMKAYSVIIQPGDSECLSHYNDIFDEGTGGVYGTALDQFAKQTGGFSSSICQSDYSSTLSQIAADVDQGLSSQITQITLKQRPVEGTVQIVSSPSAELSYTVSGKTVTFANPLPAGATLTIQYQAGFE